ncbi:hypothetical protein G5I91_002583 [Staphylococcus pseudintermedius]|uniref:hypothetical protein n=1 Tax=Staphylococcus pseudintermedius TaxID=283734 RepID=UPI001020BF17|nr:hypothetical protein [Staphylococcus pseudintermedius]EGQ0291706.1 hypothetical protein [Staphylococcus pseudintermedius]EGQ0324827.1 hypothetical protein [Staphylococcus pseudintermedius]EGQ0390021.1 hypothetical protein [Staphylococcus pseudintermedius]EGQ1319078.1 hypothetical protein [Staphylococcus pseudintermedius]EGQ1590818.1 hypothetical protein [Staphylococcus pseudintermedius]
MKNYQVYNFTQKHSIQAGTYLLFVTSLTKQCLSKLLSLMIRFVYPAHGREAELDAEAQVKFSNEKDSTSREITPETGQDLFDFDDKNK